MHRVLLVLLLFSAIPVDAQYTWVRYLQLPPDQQVGREPFDKLLAGKRIAAWGVLAPLSRAGESWTHAIYATAPNWSAFEAVTNAFDAAGLSGPRHVHDVVLRHVVQSDARSAVVPRYVVINTHPVIRGRDGDAFALFNEWAKPVFEKLEAGGKLGRWGLSVQNVVQDNQWTYLVWYFMSDLSVLDEINAALDGAGMSRLGTYERRLRDMSEDDYVGQLFRVVYAAQ